MTADPAARDAHSTLGLRFAGDPAPLLGAGPAGDALPVVRVTLTGQDEFDSRWAAARDPRLLYITKLPDGRPFLTVERDTEVGYRVWAHGYGCHLIAADGGQVLSVAPDDPEQLGFRLTASQVYPLLAALHGREVMHAGAVTIGGRVVGVAAPSGTGKSSTLAHLIAGGAEFLADDVLGLELDGLRVLAHPGPRLLNLAPDELDRVPADTRSRLGREIGRSEKVHLEPAGAAVAGPVGAIFFLERRPGAAAAMDPVPDATPLLANAALPYLDTPDRLRRQLDVLAALGAVPLLRVTVGEGEDARAVAARIRARVQDLP